MIIGYCRSSPLEASAVLDTQRRELNAFGCMKLFVDSHEPTDPRVNLAACRKLLRAGDVLVVSRMDRVTPTTHQLIKLIDGLAKRGVAVVVLSIGGQRLDTRLPAAAGILVLLRGVAAADRAVRSEYRHKGVLAGRAAGRIKPRPFKVDPASIRAMGESGLGPTAISRRVGVSRGTVRSHLGPGYRYVRPGPKSKRKRPLIDAATVRVLSHSMRPGEVAKALGISRASVLRLRGW